MNHAVLLALVPLAVPPPHAVLAPVPPAVVEAFELSPFYGKCVLVGPFPILSSGLVHDHALLEAAFLIQAMCAHRPEMLAALADSNTRFSVMAPQEMTTAIPEHSDLTPPGYWDKRARGLGATRQRPAVSCGEENLLCFKGDPYSTENILIHEFAHALHEMAMARIDPTFDDRLKACYEQAIAAGLWEGAYAATNHKEYFAEAAQSFFDTNREDDNQHNHIDTRVELAEYDPCVYAMCVEMFGPNPPVYVRPFDRPAGGSGARHLSTWDPAQAPTFAWPKAVLEAWELHQKQTLKRRPPKDDK
jgi:hypothetical protein